jgi:HSP20 family protein
MTMLTVRNRYLPTTGGWGFDDLWGSTGALNEFYRVQHPVRDTGTRFPSTKVTETDTEHVVSIASPGYKKADFDVSLLGDKLTVSTQVDEGTQNSFATSSWTRSWTVPAHTLSNDISAQYRNGVLTVTVDKVSIDSLKEDIPVK